MFDAIKAMIASRISEAGLKDVLLEILKHIIAGNDSHDDNASEIKQLKDRIIKLEAANGNPDVTRG